MSKVRAFASTLLISRSCTVPPASSISTARTVPYPSTCSTPRVVDPAGASAVVRVSRGGHRTGRAKPISRDRTSSLVENETFARSSGSPVVASLTTPRTTGTCIGNG